MSKYKDRHRAAKGPATQPERTAVKQQKTATARRERQHARRK